MLRIGHKARRDKDDKFRVVHDSGTTVSVVTWAVPRWEEAVSFSVRDRTPKL